MGFSCKPAALRNTQKQPANMAPFSKDASKAFEARHPTTQSVI